MPDIYDAFLLVSFGGPEKHDDVIPFLENVLRGRNVPRERMLEVAEHYYHLGGASPINQQCRDLIAALNLNIPVYWGNRNWHPLLRDTVEQMKADGVHRAIALATSAYGSYSGCRQYLEDIDRARATVPDAPLIDKLPPFADHPGFIEAAAERLRDAMQKLPDAEIVYTAHSIPVSMARTSPYEERLRVTSAKVHQLANAKGEPPLAFQSRSGAPGQPWLGPDINDYIRNTTAKRLIADPIGFLSDHMEVIYDLDTEAAALARGRGIEFVRAQTVGTHATFVNGIRLMVQRAQTEGVTHCAADCCPPPQRPTTRP